jgi:1-acyl-sn-glycerol-3-phosphate acyltransferase
MRRLFKAIKLASHLIIGLFIISFTIHSKNKVERAEIINRWSIKLTKIFDIKIITYGNKPELAPVNHMFLSNHISWFDIFALNSIFISRFIAKSDIQSWPVINRLCTGAGTFFIQREKIKDTKRVNESITKSLMEGDSVTFFPEGTTSDGTHLKPLKTSLVQSIITSNGTIQGIYINYLDSNGKPTDITAYIDEITITQSLSKILSSSGIEAHIYFLKPIDVSQHDRSSISAAIKAQLHEAHLNFQRTHLDTHAVQAH